MTAAAIILRALLWVACGVAIISVTQPGPFAAAAAGAVWLAFLAGICWLTSRGTLENAGNAGHAWGLAAVGFVTVTAVATVVPG